MAQTSQTDMSTADPRHRSFHLTRDTPEVATLAQDGESVRIARGWVRLRNSGGDPFAIRISSITEIVGPYDNGGQWSVQLIAGKIKHLPIGFDEAELAEQFVEDLLHDD